MSIIVGIDASRNRSGGAIAHLIGILTESNPLEHGVSEVHVWSYKSLLDALPERSWLVKHNSPAIEKSIFHQIYWQYRHLPREAKSSACQLMLYTCAGAVTGNFYPHVVMSRDMLSFEKGEMQRFGISKAFLRLVLLKFIQSRSLKRANGAIFLTKYAAKVIQQYTGEISQLAIIPHGVGNQFKLLKYSNIFNKEERTIRCVYVSNSSMYKHQWHVIHTISKLRKRGYNVSLYLIGGGKGKAQKMLEKALYQHDPRAKFIKQSPFLSHEQIIKELAYSDIYVFASSCENMPNTLLEGMAAGFPIVCSNRGPMPEILQDAGIYFNPEDPDSIANSVEEIIVNEELRSSVSKKAKSIAEQYSWERCGKETWDYLYQVYLNSQLNEGKV